MATKVAKVSKTAKKIKTPNKESLSDEIRPIVPIKKNKKELKGHKEREKNLSAGDYDLVVVESPSKAKSIKKYLGRGYQVVASNGHIKDLPKSKLGVDIKAGFVVDLVPISGKQDKIKRIQDLAKHAGKIYLAPDMDREGEAIAFHLAEEIGRKKNVHRVVFNAVTKAAVKAAIQHPTVLNEHMYESQQTRRILDRLVGYKISPILWDKVQRGISAGRVQSVALRLIVEREDIIKAFIPEKWFSISGEMQKNGTSFAFSYYGESSNKKLELEDEKQAKKIVAQVKGRAYKIVEIKKRERKQNPTPPFTTSKLQQEAAHKLGYTAKRTMMIAQRLYEGIELGSHGTQGLITYMRTDSVRTEPDSLNTLRAYIQDRYGKNYLSDEAIIYKKKGTSKVQDAHEAIRPTNLEFNPELVKGDLEPEEYKLYELIWNKFISSQMSQAIIDQTSVTFENAGHFFRANGSVIKFPGFRTVFIEAAEEKARQKKSEQEEESEENNKGILPVLSEGEMLKASQDAQAEEHWTSPPPRYSEALLVKDLEEKGIGRPSTYASIISNIQDRGYVEKIDNRFVSTELGTVVCRLLIQSFPDILNTDFTARVEEQLDKIEEGDIGYKKVLKEFWQGFEKTLLKAQEEMKNLKKQSTPTGLKCSKCKNGEYTIRWGKNGQFLACSNYPDCNSTHDFKKDLKGQITILEKQYASDPCPKCHKRMEVKKGKYGRFVRCEDHPTCDATGPFTIDVLCPECQVGKFAEKKSRFGKFFYGCSSYPNCSNALWSKPRAFDCPSCGYSLMIEKFSKKNGKQLQCPKCRHLVDFSDTPFASEIESDQERG